MAAFVDRLMLKNTSDSSATVISDLDNGGSLLLDTGELVVTTGVNDTGLLTVGEIASGSGSEYSIVRIPGYRPSGDVYWSQVNLLVNAEPGNVDKSTNNISASSLSASLSGFARHGTYSYHFDNTDRVQMAYNSVARPTNICTVDCWVYFTDLSANRGLWDHYETTNTYSMKVLYNSGTSLITATVYTSTGTYTVSSSASPQVNTWHHVALVRNDTTLVLYLDGNPSTPVSVSGNFITASYWRIGIADTTYMRGYIDDFRFTKNVARYRATFTPSEYPAGVEYGDQDDIYLTALVDVNITSVVPGQTLVYNGSQWVNGAPLTASIADMPDVNLSPLTTGDYLIYSGTEWVNTSPNSSWFIPADGGDFNTGTVASEGNYMLNGGLFT